MAPPQDSSVHIGHIFVPEIVDALKNRRFDDVKALVKQLSMIDLADIFHELSPSEQTLLFRLLNDRQAVTVFQELDFKEQNHLLSTLGDNELEGLISDFHPDEAARLFNKLPERTVKSLSRYVQKEQKASVETLMTFPENTVGHLMHSPRVSLQPNETSAQALEKIRACTRVRHGAGPDGYYVSDKAGKVVGFVWLREIIAAPSIALLSEYMNPVRLLRLSPHQDQEEAVVLFTRYKLTLAPVVDENDHLLGYVQARDILPIAQQESTEDIQKLAGVEVLDEPYFKIAFTKMVKKRATWLCVLFLGEMLTATAMGFFEKEISRAVVLALFIPLIISSGGNSGSQAASLLVRALALKEVTFRDWWKVMRREVASGLVLGLTLGAIGFCRVYLWSQFTDLYGPHYVAVAATVAVSLVLVVMWGALSGGVLPLVLRRVGLDPAVASAPFVATLVDVTGLIIYFMTASFILRGTLL